MSTSRLADRQIRAAQRAALRLDVRGPVSEALGKTGIEIPTPDEAPAPAPTPALERTVGRAPIRKKKGLTPTLKPVAETPWPTRASGDPLSGLTADERRVHRILLDTLDLTSRQGDLGNGIGYAERKRLEALDLAYINAQLAKMEKRAVFSEKAIRLGALGAVFTLGVTLAVLLASGAEGPALGTGLGFAFFLLMMAALASTQPGLLSGAGSTASGQRKQIYEALRELALLVEPAPASAAVAEADRLIDSLADADLGTADRPRSKTRARS